MFLRRFLSFWITISFTASLIVPPQKIYAQTISGLPAMLPVPGKMLELTKPFAPVMAKGIIIDPKHPFKFDFVMDSGDTRLQGEALRPESMKIIKYFLAALTVPEDEMWVNLSPYEKGRIIPKSFGETTMGRDVLAQDYILKQLTASLTYPEQGLGKKFWDTVYGRAQKEYGTTDIPVDTFNKVWILPSKAKVYEHGNGAFVVESRLKVMLEEDYLSLSKHTALQSTNQTHRVASQIVREILIPALEKEVNEGAHFANLRQIYQAMILATWYKVRMKESILGKLYVDQDKTKGVAVEDKQANQKIFQEYLQAFKKGVYNFVKEETDPVTQQAIPRKYFSGGFTDLGMISMLKEGNITDQEPIGFSESFARATIVTIGLNSSSNAAMTSMTRRLLLGGVAAAAVGFQSARGQQVPVETRPLNSVVNSSATIPINGINTPVRVSQEFTGGNLRNFSSINFSPEGISVQPGSTIRIEYNLLTEGDLIDGLYNVEVRLLHGQEQEGKINDVEVLFKRGRGSIEIPVSAFHQGPDFFGSRFDGIAFTLGKNRWGYMYHYWVTPRSNPSGYPIPGTLLEHTTPDPYTQLIVQGVTVTQPGNQVVGSIDRATIAAMSPNLKRRDLLTQAAAAVALGVVGSQSARGQQVPVETRPLNSVVNSSATIPINGINTPVRVSQEFTGGNLRNFSSINFSPEGISVQPGSTIRIEYNLLTEGDLIDGLYNVEVRLLHGQEQEGKINDVEVLFKRGRGSIEIPVSAFHQGPDFFGSRFDGIAFTLGKNRWGYMYHYWVTPRSNPSGYPIPGTLLEHTTPDPYTQLIVQGVTVTQPANQVVGSNDSATITPTTQYRHLGGIDLNAGNLDLQIKRDDKGMVLPIKFQNLNEIKIDALYPVIIRIGPPVSAPVLLSSLDSGSLPVVPMPPSKLSKLDGQYVRREAV